MRVVCGLALLTCLVALSCVSGQTFQYSKGWTNGRKRATEGSQRHQLLGPDDRAPSIAELGLLSPSSRNAAVYREVLRSLLELNKHSPLNAEISDFIASRKRSQKDDEQSDPVVFDDFNNNN